jgi:hypothetical protein
MDSMNLNSKSGLAYLKMDDGRTNGNVTMPTMEVLVDVGRFEVV